MYIALTALTEIVGTVVYLTKVWHQMISGHYKHKKQLRRKKFSGDNLKKMLWPQC